MKIKVLVDIGKTPVSADDWDLYTIDMDCTQPAQELTDALSRAIIALASGEMTIDTAFETHFIPAAMKNAQWGAHDTEPRAIAWAVLDRIRNLMEKPHR